MTALNPPVERSTSGSDHISVMLNEVIEALEPTGDGVYVDGTFGAGGYSRAILQKNVSMLWAIDRDPTVMAAAQKLGKEFPGKFALLQGCFSDMENLLKASGQDYVDGIVLDIGVSSMQLDQAERGFSFMRDGPLDMRMGDQGKTAADVVNETEEEELANIIYQFGEERASRRVARAIVEARAEKDFEGTLELSKVVEKAVGGPKYKKGKRQIHGATRTFQALRIYVNDELGELRRGLEAAEKMLSPGGRLCVVTFHSLEDRIVKEFFKLRSGDISRGSRHMPVQGEDMPDPTFSMTFRGGKKASKNETDINIRSRSAKLRAAVRTNAPAWVKEVTA
ncbi:MAG: 16S rRNA (cytosine(1402)-N(4))-methyltransferase RsmH [Kordiimonadaceae bacterium]|jgi:16S rRNA (cytosine1402-N4)-methyltransferase|nr:16S rRNA (cytosine(1402)-N(4))-methyltransferase RsmH [Kordiimonadaceae bacterium]MBT6036443.1 16S rRNA (cytosine(1402)-N(4))-methyltransferase RsmH [Kordiimonadaceae bacterium]MBT6329296.1 16S rRNA (cytosine(1402)-N(4))-methyltransferase RsmH [Kordiimonadaceae bacterium]